MPDATLLTGATGFLGMELLAQLVRDDDRPVLCLVRAEDEEEAQTRLAAVRAAVFGDAAAHADRVTAVRGELTRDGLGLAPSTRDELKQRVARVVHGAASVSFAATLQDARAVNVEGTRRVLELARECEGLERVVHVSTAYVAGARRGDCHAHELDASAPHRNAYERSKAEAEVLVREAMGEMPAIVTRPSIVVGHSQTGWTASFNVMYGPLRAFAAGALPVIPGRRDAPVDVVPVDFVARGVVEQLRNGTPGDTVHLTAGRGASSVAELCALGTVAFDMRGPRVVPPWVYGAALHPLLKRTGPHARRKAMRRGEVYLPYFSARCSYTTDRDAPPLREYFDTLIAFAKLAGWGRRSVTRYQAARRLPVPSVV